MNPILLHLSDAEILLTKAEDSLETIADVLIDMRSLVNSAVAKLNIEPDSPKVVEGRSIWRWINGTSYSRNDRSSFHATCTQRLIELSCEIDDIVADSTYADTPLFGKYPPASAFVVQITPTETLGLSFESISAAELSVAAYHLGIDDDSQVRATHERIDVAMSNVQLRLHSVSERREHLNEYRDRHLERRIHPSNSTVVRNLVSMRDQLEHAKLRITDASHNALLAQANATSDSTLRLIETLFRDEDAGRAARIYSLDHDRDTEPVTHLRRIMLGHDASA